jgi:catechol 2,3-dioxygenase-like lactoylglutathione lyase family enzyme
MDDVFALFREATRPIMQQSTFTTPQPGILPRDSMSTDLLFHHVGMLVDLIEKHSALYVERFGYELKSEIIHDPKQTAYVQFLAFPGQNVYLELVAPDAPNSFLSNALQKGGGLNHVCYSTVDIDAACDHLRSKKMLLLRPPTEAVAFDHRRIAWMKGRDNLLVELVERDNENRRPHSQRPRIG